MKQDTFLGHQIKNQNYGWALRQEMGYPLYAPANDCTAFAGGGVADLARSLELGSLASQMRKDIVYLGWDQVADDEPVSISVALRTMVCVDWIDELYPWAADESSPVLLVSARGDDRIAVGSRGLLERRRGRAEKSLKRGKAIAAQRIRYAASRMPQRLADNNVYVPQGAPWMEPAFSTADTIVRFG